MWLTVEMIRPRIRKDASASRTQSHPRPSTSFDPPRQSMRLASGTDPRLHCRAGRGGPDRHQGVDPRRHPPPLRRRRGEPRGEDPPGPCTGGRRAGRDGPEAIGTCRRSACCRPSIAVAFLDLAFFQLSGTEGRCFAVSRTQQRTSPADAGARTQTDGLDFVPSGHPCPQPFDAPPEGRALDVNIKEEGGQGRTAVHVAAFHGAEVACQTCAAVAAS